MNNDNATVVGFCRMLAQIRKMFREAHIFAEKSPGFKQVSTTVSHGEKDIIDLNDRHPAVEISFSTDAELKHKIDDEKFSLGVSVAIFFVQDEWQVQGSVGWSCVNSGWEEIDSFELTAKTLDVLENSVTPLAAETLECYRKAIVLHSR